MVPFVEELALDAVEGRATLSVFASDRFSPLHSASAAATQQFREKVRLERGVEVRTATLRMSSSNSKRGSGSKGHLKMDTRGHDVSVAVGAGDRCAISQVYRVSWRFSDSTTTRRATRRRWSFIAAVDSSRAPSDRTTSVISPVCSKLTASCFTLTLDRLLGVTGFRSDDFDFDAPIRLQTGDQFRSSLLPGAFARFRHWI